MLGSSQLPSLVFSDRISEGTAIAAGAGGIAGIWPGSGEGERVSGKIAQKDMNRGEATASQGEEGDGTEELCDTAPLICTVPPPSLG